MEAVFLQLSMIVKAAGLSAFLLTITGLSSAAVTTPEDGTTEVSFSSYRSHDHTFSQNRNVSAWQNISGSTRAMVQTSEIQLGDDNTKQYGAIRKFAAGFYFSSLKSSTSIWLDQYESARASGGFRIDSRYYADRKTSIVCAITKMPVIDLDTLGFQGKPLLTTDSYTVKVERVLTADKDFAIGLTRGLYSDDNKNTAYSLQYGQTVYDRGRDRLRIGAYGYKVNWDTVSQWYGNPLSSKSYGVTTAYGVRDGKGRWTTTFTGAWGADNDNPIEFWPSLQLQYRYQASAKDSVMIGFASGLRTDKASELEGLRHNYRQINAAYQANW